MVTTPKKDKRGGRPPEHPAVRRGHAERLNLALHAIYPPPGVPNESDAARRCGLSPGRINDVRNRRRSLGREDLRALSKGLGISADYLLGTPGAPMFVGEQFKAGLEAAARDYVMRGIESAARGAPWKAMFGEFDTDAVTFLGFGIAHELERIRIAWSSAETMSREESNQGLPLAAKRERLFWIWMKHGKPGALFHRPPPLEGVAGSLDPGGGAGATKLGPGISSGTQNENAPEGKRPTKRRKS